MEEFLSTFGSSVWGPIALAFLFGVAFGWVVWGIKPRHASVGGEASRPLEPKELVVLKAELHAAKALLEKPDDMDAIIAESLASLDESVGRASDSLLKTHEFARRGARA